MPPDPAVSPAAAPAARTVPARRRLLLLRHAKAGAHDDDHDHGRDLDPRAVEQCAAVSGFMHARNITPDRVLSSDSVRTRRTWELLAPGLGLGVPPPLLLSSRLYLADAAILLSVLREAPDDARTLLLVAHNPGIHALVLALAGRERASHCHLAGAMPTATLAVLDLIDDAPWSVLSPDRIADCSAFRP